MSKIPEIIFNTLYQLDQIGIRSFPEMSLIKMGDLEMKLYWRSNLRGSFCVLAKANYDFDSGEIEYSILSPLDGSDEPNDTLILSGLRDNMEKLEKTLAENDPSDCFDMKEGFERRLQAKQLQMLRSGKMTCI